MIGNYKFYLLLLILFSAFILSFPLLVNNDYYISVMVITAFHTILAVSLNLLMGYAGQISIGHGAFYGLGAYVSGILSVKYGLSPFISIIISTASVSLIAFIIGLPTLRLKGHYLAMGTLGIALIVYVIINNSVELTGGPSGLPQIPKFAVGNFILDSDISYYYFSWSITLAIIFLLLNLVYSGIGRMLLSVNMSEIASKTLGIQTFNLKLKVFVLSAFLASLSGALYAHYIGFLSPVTFNLNISIEVVTMVIIGGLANFFGSIFGAIILTVLPEWLRFLKDYDILVFGAVLILCMIYLPEGIFAKFKRGIN